MAKAKTKPAKASVTKVVEPEEKTEKKQEETKPVEAQKPEASKKVIELVSRAKEARAAADFARESGTREEIIATRKAAGEAKRAVNEYRAANPEAADAIEELLA